MDERRTVMEEQWIKGVGDVIEGWVDVSGDAIGVGRTEESIAGGTFE